MRPQATKVCNHVKNILNAQVSNLDRENLREVLEELGVEIDARLSALDEVSALDEDTAKESTGLKKFPHYGNQ